MSCHLNNLLLINQKIYVHGWVFVCCQYWGILIVTPSQPFSLGDASRDVGYGNSKTHVQYIRERDCSFVTDLYPRSRQSFARNHELPYSLWLPYGMILWALRVLGQGLNQSARIFFTRVFCVVTPYWRAPKRAKQLSMATIPLCFWVLSVSCWCLAELIFT